MPVGWAFAPVPAMAARSISSPMLRLIIWRTMPSAAGLDCMRSCRLSSTIVPTWWGERVRLSKVALP